jgi:hypothetical protein
MINNNLFEQFRQIDIDAAMDKRLKEIEQERENLLTAAYLKYLVYEILLDGSLTLVAGFNRLKDAQIYCKEHSRLKFEIKFMREG